MPIQQQVEENYKLLLQKHINSYQKQLLNVAYRIIPECPPNWADSTKNFYKIIERHFGKYLCVRLGYKICKITKKQQDLALYLFSVFQTQAQFSIKIWLKSNENRQQNDIDQQEKVAWMQTVIMLTNHNQNNYSQIQLKLQSLIDSFLKRLSIHLKQFLRQQNNSLLTMENYSIHKTIQKLQKLIKQYNQLFQKKCQQNLGQI